MSFSIEQFRLSFLVLSLWLGIISGFKFYEHDWVWLSAVIIGFSIGAKRFGISLRYFAILLVTILVAFLLALFRINQLQSIPLAQMQSEIEFVILQDPVERAAAFGFAGETEVQVLVDASNSSFKNLPLLLTSADLQLLQARIGSTWECDAELQKQTQPRRYLGYAVCESPPIQVKPAKQIQYFADAFRIGLRSVTSDRDDSEAAALLPGLVLGDTSAQSAELENALQIAGLGHLTAVSGANVAIVLLAIEILLRRSPLSAKSRLLVLAIVAWFFMLIVRPSPSVVRATAMAGFGLLSLWYGQPRLSLLSLNLATLGLLVIDPYLAISVGFQLSVAATLGLILFPKIWQISSSTKFWWRAFATAAAASLATLPILLAADLNPTFASIPANLLAEVLVAPATLAGVVAALFAVLSGTPGIGGLFYFLAVAAAKFGLVPAALIVQIAHWAEDSIFQVSVQSEFGFGLLVASAISVWAMRRRKWSFPAIASILSIGLSVSLWGNEITSVWNRKWDIAVCDVGQGDSSVIRVADGVAVVIDTGPDAIAVEDCLDSLNIKSVPLFIASHFHADHVGGVTALVERDVAEVWIPDTKSPVSMSDFVFTQLSTSQIRTPAVGEIRSFGEITLQVLQAPKLTDGDSGSEINNASLVIAAFVAGKQILFTGDIEELAQNQLMRAFVNVDFDLVKVPHHGSAAGNPDFADWSNGEIAWVSAGLDNPYGHPHPTTIRQYQLAGMKLFSTIDCGQLGFQLSAPEINLISEKVCHPL